MYVHRQGSVPGGRIADVQSHGQRLRAWKVLQSDLQELQDQLQDRGGSVQNGESVSQQFYLSAIRFINPSLCCTIVGAWYYENKVNPDLIKCNRKIKLCITVIKWHKCLFWNGEMYREGMFIIENQWAKHEFIYFLLLISSTY